MPFRTSSLEESVRILGSIRTNSGITSWTKVSSPSSYLWGTPPVGVVLNQGSGLILLFVYSSTKVSGSISYLCTPKPRFRTPFPRQCCYKPRFKYPPHVGEVSNQGFGLLVLSVLFPNQGFGLLLVWSRTKVACWPLEPTRPCRASQQKPVLTIPPLPPPSTNPPLYKYIPPSPFASHTPISNHTKPSTLVSLRPPGVPLLWSIHPSPPLSPPLSLPVYSSQSLTAAAG